LTVPAPAADEPRGGRVVVGAACTALAVIFGVSCSFAAFFASFEGELGAERSRGAGVRAVGTRALPARRLRRHAV
jgi:hypothetical protein